MRTFLTLIILLISTLPAWAETPANTVTLDFINDDIKIAPGTFADARPMLKYFTAEMKDLLNKNIRFEAASVKNTPKGDMPCIPDAEFFFSNTEHVGTVKIIGSTGSENSETVNVKLSYEKHEWTAQLILKKENGEWLIDNIYDSGWKKGDSLKTYLTGTLKQKYCHAGNI